MSKISFVKLVLEAHLEDGSIVKGETGEFPGSSILEIEDANCFIAMDKAVHHLLQERMATAATEPDDHDIRLNVYVDLLEGARIEEFKNGEPVTSLLRLLQVRLLENLKKDK